jgi:hypothetical protein
MADQFRKPRKQRDLSLREMIERAATLGSATRDSSPSRTPEPHTQPGPRADSDHEHHPTTKIFDYIGLGLLLAPPSVVAELYLRGEPINWGRAVIVTLVSWLGGALSLWAARKWRVWGTTIAAAENTFWAKALVVAFCVAFPSLVSAFFSQSPNFKDLPNSPDGLAPGTIWNDGGVLAIVPSEDKSAEPAQPSPDAAKKLSDQARTIQELQAQVAQLQAPYWNALTPIELGELGKRLKQVPPRSITINCNIGQCRDLASSFMAGFSLGGWTQTKLDTETTWIGPGTGIEIIPGDDTARLLKAAIEGATSLRGIKISPYNSQVSGIGPNQTVITMGARPLQ